MFLAALALAAHLVQPGDTLSGIAASHGISLSRLESANPQIANPDLIYAGEPVTLPGSDGQPGHSTARPFSPSHHIPGQSRFSGSPSPAASSSDLASVPGVPRAFAACVALRESSNGSNQAFNGGVYGIINASGEHVNGQSLTAQKAAFSRLYARYGTAPWHPSDGC